KQLTILYLTKALQNRYSPLISTRNSSIPLHDKFVSHLGVKFSASEKQLIYNQLEPLVSKAELDSLIIRIENARNDFAIGAKDFGLSLAICHAASGDMLEKKLSFELNKQARSSAEKDSALSKKIDISDSTEAA